MEHFIVVKPCSAVLPIGYIFQGTGLNSHSLMPCDGRALDKMQYSELYQIIGIQYGGSNGSSTFNIPDLRPNQVIIPEELVYQDYWETWPCVHCRHTFSDGHDRSTWWCFKEAGRGMFHTTYYPMTNLEYLELKVKVKESLCHMDEGNMVK
jgi:hypothetical protein